MRKLSVSFPAARRFTSESGTPAAPDGRPSRADPRLLARLGAVAAAHLADPNLTPARLAAATHLSERTLYRRLLTLTGLTPAGLSITPFTAPTTAPTGTGTGSGTGTTSGGGTSPPGANVPEPVSIALWSVAAGLGLLRAKAFRRARQLEV